MDITPGLFDPSNVPLTNDEIYKGLMALKYPEQCNHLARKNLGPEVWEKIKDKKTKRGGHIGHCLYSAIKEPGAKVAFHATDPETYILLAPYTDLIIRDYHQVPAGKEISHPQCDFGDLDNLPFGDLDPEGTHVISTRVRTGRAAAGYAWPPIMTLAEREEIEAKAKAAYATLPEEFAGEYHTLQGLSDEKQEELIRDHFLFRMDDKYKLPSGGYRDWPKGRGIFLSKDKKFHSWVNEGDHFRFISMDMGGDLAKTYSRFVKIVKTMEKKIPFARSDRLGYLSFCPTNLGTAMRASVHAKIPKIASDEKLFKEVCAKYHIQARGVYGELSDLDSKGGIFDLSNKRRLGLTELQTVTEMAEGIKAIIKLEKELEKK